MRLYRHLKGSLSLRLGSNLNLAAYRNSLAHSTKGTPSPRSGAPTACRRTVSGTVSLPLGVLFTFLTVLVRYRSQESVQPWRASPRLHRVHVPGATRAPHTRSPARIRVRALTCSAGLPRPFASARICNCVHGLRRMECAHLTTLMQQRLKLARAWVWAGAVSLAATPAISVDSSGYLDVSVPGYPSRPISFRRG